MRAPITSVQRLYEGRSLSVYRYWTDSSVSSAAGLCLTRRNGMADKFSVSMVIDVKKATGEPYCASQITWHDLSLDEMASIPELAAVIDSIRPRNPVSDAQAPG